MTETSVRGGFFINTKHNNERNINHKIGAESISNNVVKDMSSDILIIIFQDIFVRKHFILAVISKKENRNNDVDRQVQPTGLEISVKIRKEGSPVILIAQVDFPCQNVCFCVFLTLFFFKIQRCVRYVVGIITYHLLIQF